MTVKFAVIAVRADDVAEAAHFYRNVLELDLLAHHDERPHFDVDGVYLTILQRGAAPAQSADSPRFPLFALAVNDLDERVARLERHGVAMPWGMEANEGSRWVMLRDPAGNLIELVQFGEA
jgi:predicted enzyme related to lactoylglutathione lyase